MLWRFVSASLIADDFDKGIVTQQVKIHQAKLTANKFKGKENEKDSAAIIDKRPKLISFFWAFKIPMVEQ